MSEQDEKSTVFDLKELSSEEKEFLNYLRSASDKKKKALLEALKDNKAFKKFLSESKGAQANKRN